MTRFGPSSSNISVNRYEAGKSWWHVREPLGQQGLCRVALDSLPLRLVQKLSCRNLDLILCFNVWALAIDTSLCVCLDRSVSKRPPVTSVSIEDFGHQSVISVSALKCAVLSSFCGISQENRDKPDSLRINHDWWGSPTVCWFHAT